MYVIVLLIQILLGYQWRRKVEIAHTLKETAKTLKALSKKTLKAVRKNQEVQCATKIPTKRCKA